MANYSVEQRVFMVKKYFSTKSFKQTTEMFVERFGNQRKPSKSCIFELVNLFQTTGSVTPKKHQRKRTVLTPTKVDEISQLMQASPSISLRQLKSKTNVSQSSCYTVVRKMLKLRPYKISTVHKLLDVDPDARINYCRWMMQAITNGTINLDLTFFSDEAWFSLDGYLNSQNNRFWSLNNPHVFIESPLHSKKVGVICFMSRRRIIGPIFFRETLNSDRFIQLFNEFVTYLTEEEKNFGYLQMDGATCHTSKRTRATVAEIFNDRIIIKPRWPARSPDLTPLDFYLWGNLKEKVYKDTPESLDCLEHNITQSIRNIVVEEIELVFKNMMKRLQMCLDCDGHHFQHFM